MNENNFSNIFGNGFPKFFESLFNEERYVDDGKCPRCKSTIIFRASKDKNFCFNCKFRFKLR